MGNITIKRKAKEQELIDRMNKAVGQKIIVKDTAPVIKAIQGQSDAQPRDSKGRFASNKDQGTQLRPQQQAESTTSTFDKLCDNLKEVHAAKNADYGNSWVKHLMKYGLRPFTMRVSEKVNRIDAIIDNGKAFVKDESIKDTLIDIAAYALMTAAELEDDKDNVILDKSK